MADIESLPLSNRVVLLTMTHLSLTGETPAHTGQVIRACTDHLEAVDAETLGKLAEAEVNRALNRLEAEEVVEMAPVDDTSPVGKGRPAYALAVDEADVFEELGDDDAVAPLVERVEQKA